MILDAGVLGEHKVDIKGVETTKKAKNPKIGPNWFQKTLCRQCTRLHQLDA